MTKHFVAILMGSDSGLPQMEPTFAVVKASARAVVARDQALQKKLRS